MFYYVDPPEYQGETQDLSIHNLINDMQDLTKTVYVEIENDDHLVFVVDGYNIFSGDFCHLQDYSPTTRQMFMREMRGEAWEYTQRYTISHIGLPDRPPVRKRHEKWLRW